MTDKQVAVVAGASGFVGREIVAALRADGYDVRRIGRTEHVGWNGPRALVDAVDGAGLLINLAGKSVNCRYTHVNRNEILRSRVETTRALRHAVAAAENPPPLWLNAATATIYRHEEQRPNDESSGILGEGFSVDVAREWEREFFADELPRTRRVALRMAIVLGNGPAPDMLRRLARWGLGGPQIDSPWFPHRRYRGIESHPTGSARPGWRRTRGRQKFSWIHIDDVIGAVRFLAEHEEITGAVNLASPEPTDNRTLMRALRRKTGMPIGLPVWRWMLEPAMWVLRTEPELVLKSRWVVPGVLDAAGYTFRRPHLEDAI